MNLNKVILAGNVTADPEVRYTPKGTAVCDIRLAVNRYIGSEDGDKRQETAFIDATAWARTAEIAGEYLKKGSEVLLEGRLQLEQWEDKQTGQKRSKLRVIIEDLQLTKKSGGEARGGHSGSNYSNNRLSSQADNGYGDEPTGDDIPF